MKIVIKEDGSRVFKKVYSGILLESDDGEEIGICMRDTGFEFNYQGVWYEAKDGVVRKMCDYENPIK